MPCDPELTTFSATGPVTPMSAAELSGGFGQCADPKPTTGRLNWVLNWLSCHLGEVKATAEGANPCTATAATAAQAAGIDADDKVSVCIDGVTLGVNVLDLPFATQSDLDAIGLLVEAVSPCTSTPITAAEQTALDADLSTGSVTVCIPDGAGSKTVSVGLDALLIGGGIGEALPTAQTPAVNVWYQNTAGKPILVTAEYSNALGGSLWVGSVANDPAAINVVSFSGDAGLEVEHGTFMVPSGAWYMANWPSVAGPKLLIY